MFTILYEVSTSVVINMHGCMHYVSIENGKLQLSLVLCSKDFYRTLLVRDLAVLDHLV